MKIYPVAFSLVGGIIIFKVLIELGVEVTITTTSFAIPIILKVEIQLIQTISISRRSYLNLMAPE